MKLFLKVLIVWLSQANYFHQTVYFPLHLFYLEIQWPGMIKSLLPEPKFQYWRADWIEGMGEVFLLYGLVYGWSRFLFPAIQHLYRLLVAQLAPRLSLILISKRL